PHSDQHYVLDAPGLSEVYFACDGGLSSMSYSTFSLTVVPSVLNTIWNNSGLDIAQVDGFSGAGSDTTLYVTGELDRNGEIYDFSTTAQVKNPGYWENEGGLVDEFDNDTVLYNPINGDHYWVSGDGGTSFGGDLCTYEPTSPTNIAPGTVDCELAPWADNSFFQDPSRPGKMYYGTNYLNQLDQGLFVVKLRPFVAFSRPWTAAQVLGGAISPIYKNGFYAFTTNRVYAVPDTESAYVIKFIGADIDNCWAGHNEDAANWQLMLPNYRGVYAGTPWSYTFAESDLLNIHIGAMVVSTWNPNKIWIACAPTSKYPLLKVMQYDGTNWTDYSNGIPAGDVARSLVMEIGTNDGMYLGTNRAIYYRNATMSSWVVFNDGPLPEVMMSQLEINYYENKLRVGTYGRGIWESSFECPSNTNLTFTSSSASEFDEASQSITSTANVASSSTVYYRAGQDVILNQGFYAVPGSNFYAFVHPCSGSGNSMIDRPEGGPTSVGNSIKGAQNENYRIEVYPNPSGGKFTVQLPEDGVSEVHVYNLLGSEIYTGTGLSKQVEINLGEQPKGIYFVRAIETKTGEIDVKKIMIQ
ncbi:MAG TPA: T9SS type A sorting domain-containing protein, partial [Bacteroidia bacterium]|nr:T9SS type A sorting domain-containing protein [Bacteroidia bacterium]